ncbi:MAG: cupin domain-containing protein [Acidobacteriota bacterium]
MKPSDPSNSQKLTRRDFSALLPMLLAAAPVTAEAEGKAGTHSLQPLKSGRYAPGPGYGSQRPSRTSHRFLIGMLPNNIRLEAHLTMLTPGAPPEPIEHHKHSEMWFVHEGAVSLMTGGETHTLKAGEMGLAVAGTDHSVWNASKTEPASYFVVTAGPPE